MAEIRKESDIKHVPLPPSAHSRNQTTSWNNAEKNGISSVVELASALIKPESEKEAKSSLKVRKIEWPVSNWDTAPKSVNVCSNYWNWTERSMERTARGFSTTVELNEDKLPSAEHPFLFKFVVDGVWQCSKVLPISVDNAGIQNNYLDFSD